VSRLGSLATGLALEQQKHLQGVDAGSEHSDCHRLKAEIEVWESSPLISR
jgi:hypothetical protein